MIVCHCNAVSDRAIRDAIRAGASSRGAVARRCGAGTYCGGCAPAIDALLDLERACPDPAPESVPDRLAALAPA
jgi:bacterioferritin-associated ferredoxin